MLSFAFLSGRGAGACGLVVASVLNASCLESSATLPTVDAGMTHSDTGTSHTLTGTDAHTGVDATTGTDAHGGADTSTGSDAAVVPLCMNPSTADKACFSCVDTMCATEVGPAIACSSFYTCFQACACSDATCLGACVSAAPESCDAPLENLNKCQTTTCGSACNPPDAALLDASTPAGDAGVTCKNPSTTYKACAACDESKCAADVSDAKGACAGSSFPTCSAACDCSDSMCVEGCATASGVPQACVTDLTNLYDCQTSSCTAACSGATDGGTKDSGGATGTVPDCKSPTNTQAAAYASCLACDNQYCGAYLSAAVVGCSTYYSCISGTDCSTALSSCTASSGCDTAAAPLTECQDFYCGFACAGLY